MRKQYTIVAFTENKPGVLYRIADLFLRRKINIESLTVSETEQKGISRFTIVVFTDAATVEKVVKQLYRIIEMLKVFESEDKDLIFKEIAFFKVSTKNPSQRREVEDLAYLFRANVTYVGEDFLVLEKTGKEEAISSLFYLLKPFGIKEFVRSGRIAVLKGEQQLGGKFLATVKEPSRITSAIEVSAIKRIELMRREIPGVISLAQGTPSFFTPAHIKAATKEAIDKNLVDKYTPGFGIDPLREAICTKLARDNQIIAEPAQIIVTHGAIEGLMAVFLALFNPEDELLILTPDYASHVTQVSIARHGGRPIFVPLREEKQVWVLDPERVEAAITQKTKGILICNPSNPTGKVYTAEELKQIARIAIKYNLFIITDEIYEYFVFDGKQHISIGSFPEVQDRTISIFGVSKSFSMTGWRIGYLVTTKKLVQQIFKVHDSLITCSTAVSQYAALAALRGSTDCIVEFKDAYEARRKIVLTELGRTDKLTCSVPEGAYYAFPQVKTQLDDYELAIRLVNEAKVALVPGSAFGLGGEGHLRISFCFAEDELKEGLHRFVQYLEELG